MKTVDFFLDVETLGTKPGAAILEIGAFCKGDCFDCLIDLNSHEGKIDIKTLYWWATEPDILAKKHVFCDSAKRLELSKALQELADFIAKKSPTHFWGCAPDFDYGHLAFWFERYGLEIPWRYYQLRDVRTVRDFLPQKELERLKFIATSDEGRFHTAKVDACYEAVIVQEVRRRFRPNSELEK